MGFSTSSAADSEHDDLNDLREINVTPFIDVMLVLLIIFMVAAPLSTANVPLELPSTTRAAVPEEQKPLVVSLQADGSLHVGDHPVSREEFAGALRTASEGQGAAEKRVFLRADKSVSYEALVKLMDLLRDNGFVRVSLVGLEAPAGAAGA